MISFIKYSSHFISDPQIFLVVFDLFILIIGSVATLSHFFTIFGLAYLLNYNLNHNFFISFIFPNFHEVLFVLPFAELF